MITNFLPISDKNEYIGFKPQELAEITVEYREKKIVVSKVFKILILQKIASNTFYPEPYLIICPELELEGTGVTKDAAFKEEL